MGRLKEVPGIFSRGRTIVELEANIRDVYQLMLADAEVPPRPDVQTSEITVNA